MLYLTTALQAVARSFENMQTVSPLSLIILIDCHFTKLSQLGSLHPPSILQTHHKSSWALSNFPILNFIFFGLCIYFSRTSLKMSWNLLGISMACIYSTAHFHKGLLVNSNTKEQPWGFSIFFSLIWDLFFFNHDIATTNPDKRFPHLH